MNTALILLSAISFVGYGLGCFGSSYLKEEFVRYRMGSLRLLVGWMQCLAGVGLIAGLSHPWMGQLAAAGLLVMMAGAVGVRIMIRDSLFQTLPALFYLALNLYLLLAAF